MRKKVLILSSFPAPYRVAVFRELARTYDIDLFFGMNSNEDRNKDWYATSEELPFQILDNAQAKKSFSKSLRTIRQYDFVFVYDVNQIPGYELVTVCRLMRIPYFVNCDGAIIKRNLIKDLVKRYLFGGASGCFSSGKSATDYFLTYGVSKKKIFEHRFSSLEEADILAEVIPVERKSFQKNKLKIKDMPTVISVGQFIPRKGFDVLLAAWKKLDSQYQLLIIGGGGLEAEYKKYIQTNSLHNVEILGFMPKQILTEYYKACDLFVLPTREDIWGLVVNEAMACGLPVITTRNCVAGIELISNGENGFIVEVDNPRQLADKISFILSDKENLLKMSECALESIKGCTMKAIANSHIESVEQVLG